MPLVRIGGAAKQTPPVTSTLQTDGSFYIRNRLSRVAFILSTPREDFRRMFEIEKVKNSTEAEWASIAYGIQFSLQQDERVIAIENDNLGVIGALTLPGKRLKEEYARYYRNEIYRMAEDSVWIGARWIPRGQNKADKLF